MLYILIWCIIAVLSFMLFKKTAGSMSLLKPNLLSITFYYSLMISSFIGSLLIALNIDEHYMVDLLSDDSYRLIGFVTLCFIMLFMPLSMYAISTLTGFRAEKELNEYLNKDVHYQHSSDRFVYLIYFGRTGLASLAVLYTIYYSGDIPILNLLKGGGSDLAASRIEAARGFGGSTVVRNILAIGLTPILSFITFTYMYKTKRMRWALLFFITFSEALFIQVYDLSKGPIFFYILMFILLLLYLKVIRLTWTRVFLIGGTGVAALVFLYVVVQGVTDAEQFLSFNRGPIGRLILSQIAGYYLHLEMFTDKVDLLYGKSLPSTLIGLYDLEPVRSARLAIETYFPGRVESGTAGVLNTIFAGEAYANFGYAGLVIGTIYVGVFIQILYILFLRLPKNPLFLALFIYFTVNVPRIVIGGFADFVLNTLWIALCVILISPFVLLKLRDLWIYRKQHMVKR